MTEKYDAIVLGTGGVGSAALMHLAQRGMRVLGIDQFEHVHDRGSSHGQTRIIRQAYFEHPDYVPLLRRAYETWSELEQATDQQLYHQVGLLEIGPVEGIVVPGVLKAAKEHQLRVEQLDSQQTMERFPQFRIADGFSAVFEEDAGYLLVEQCVKAHLQQAIAAGAKTRTNEPVISWHATDSQVEVRTSQATYQAGQLVIAAGAWSVPLVSEFGVSMRVLQKHLYWFDDLEEQFTDGCPTYLFELPQGIFYGFPELNAQGIKVAAHSGGESVADPTIASREENAADRVGVQRFLRECLPGVATTPNHMTTCFYTMTPDEHFIVDRHPEHSNVVFAAGLSGHGFKFTSVLGEILADLTLTGTSPQPIDFLRLGRPGLRGI